MAADPEIAALDEAALVAGIDRLRRERGAVVMAHSYQLPAVQDLADVVGDSLELARRAAASEADVVVVCGVRFMAETAAILNPGRTVLLPEPEAGCSLSDAVTGADVRRWRAEHPTGLVVAYVNTDADVKSEADVCCTSANAVDVVAALPSDREVLFVPDRHLGRHVEQRTGRSLHLWPGEYHVHAAIDRHHVEVASQSHPCADLLLHPECPDSSPDDEDSRVGPAAGETFVLSTEGMARHLAGCPVGIHLIGTEVGMLHRLRQERPSTRLIPVRDDAVCAYMRATTVAKVYRALRDSVHEVHVSEPTASRAREALERMLVTRPG